MTATLDSGDVFDNLTSDTDVNLSTLIKQNFDSHVLSTPPPSKKIKV